jgi:hypothetical protein
MTTETNRQYRFLDGATEREALIEDIHRVRQEVFKIAALVPADKQHEPRYHGWSLAAMLAHLQLMDRLLLWLIQSSLLGIRLPIPLVLLNRFNDTMAGVYKGRVVDTTINGIRRYEITLADFIRRLPIDKFSKIVYDPALETNLTVEQALQEFFLFHWEDHLQTMRQVEDIFYEPPAASSLL